MKKLLTFGLVFFLLIGVASAVDIASDGFESNSFCGGYGWNDCWATSGTGQFIPFWVPHDGSIGAYLNGNGTITRETTTTEYENIRFGFWLQVNNPPHRVSYIDGSGETVLLDRTTSSSWTYYEFDLPADTVSVKFDNYGFQSQSYVDTILIEGDVASEPEVLLTMEDNYVVGSNAQITLSSTETDTIHNLALSYPNGTVFCEKVLLSPSVSQTSFSTICELPDEQVIDAKAYFYVSGDESINTSKFFNVVNLDNDPSALNIEEVYFSEQVLQGGSTEIFALIDTDLNITDIHLEITFPDDTTRILPMYLTPNDEYRAFITDTYRTGNTSFKIIVQSQDYFDEYENQYVVAPYNVDFVDAVNNVNEILSQPPTIDVLGTYYEVGDTAKVIAQLSTSGAAINNATCYASIYTPDNDVYLRNTIMEYVENSDGLYVYDMLVPNIVGVYPLSVVCDYITNDTTYYVMGASYEYGTSTGGGTELWFDDEVYSNYTSETVGNEELFSVNLTYTGITYTNATVDFYVEWEGFTDMPSGGEGFFYLYNYDTSSWDQTTNSISSDITSVSFTVDENISSYINNGNLTLKFNGSIDAQDSEVTLFSDDFEDGNSNGWTQNNIQRSPGYIFEDEINGNFAAGIEGSGGQGTTEIGALEYYLDTSGYDNITFSYERKSEGAETSDNFAVQVTDDGGSTWDTLESWNGNSGTSSETFVLSSNYVTSDFGLRFYASTNRDNDELFFDDVEITGNQQSHYTIFSDFITLHVVEASGVVNEVRGGGEFNVKDRLADIEDTLDDIADGIGVVQDNVIDVFYSMPQVYSQQDNPLLGIYASKDDEPVIGAACDVTIFGPANETSIGPEQISEYTLTELGGGQYYNVFTNPMGWQNGIYTIETNCVDGVDDGYLIDGFRMEADYEKYLQEINTTTVSIEGFNVTLQSLNSSMNSEMPMVMIGGTEYESGEEGLVAIRLTKIQGNNQVLITGATCTADILYPNQTSFVSGASMTEYGSDAIYYYNFTTPSTEGVYIYSVDCSKGSKDYYAMNTFHVAPWANYINTLSNFNGTSLLDYLQDINTTVTTIDGRTVDILSNVTDTNTRLIQINGTIVDIYDLLVQMNATISNIENYANDINATVVDIQGTVNNIETVVLAINDTTIRIEQNTLDINTTVNTINSKVDQVNLTLQQVLDYLDNISSAQINYTDEFDQVFDYLEDINDTQVNYTSELNTIIDYLQDINNTQCNCSQFLDYLQDINSSNTDIYDLLVVVNATGNINYSQELQDIYDLLVQVNSTQYDYSSNFTSIFNQLDTIENNQINYTGDINTILDYLDDINSSQINYTDELSDIYDLLVVVNGTQFNYTGEFDDIFEYLDNLSAINYTGDLDDIYDLLVQVNSTQYDYSTNFTSIFNQLDTIENNQINYTQNLTDIYNLLLQVNSTQYDYAENFTTLYDLLIQVNSTQYDYAQNFTDVYSLLQVINSTQVNYSDEFDGIFLNLTDIQNQLDVIEGNQINYTQEIQDIYDLLVIVNQTQVNYSQELQDIYDLVNASAVNYTQELTDIYDLLVVVNSTQYDYSQNFTDVFGNLTYMTQLLQNINGSQVDYSAEFTNITSFLQNITDIQADHSQNFTTLYDLLIQINSTQYDYASNFSAIFDYLVDINDTQFNYSQELADIYALLLNVNNTVSNDTQITSILSYLDDINTTVTDAYVLSLVMNSTLNDVYQLGVVTNSTVNDIYAVTLATNLTVNDIWNLTQQLELDLDELYNLNVVMNGSLNTIISDLDALNVSIVDIAAVLDALNLSIVDIYQLNQVINSTVTNINSTVNNIYAATLDINGTVTDIEAGVLTINSTVNDIYSLLEVVNGTTADNYQLLLDLNLSLTELGIDISEINSTLNDVYALNLVMNDSLWFLENISIEMNESLAYINQTTTDTYSLLLTVNATTFSYLAEFAYIAELINNQTAYLEIALADVAYFNESLYNASDYYQNHTLDTPSILETQLMSFSIDMLEALEGETFKINYYFYNADNGELTKEVQETVLANGSRQVVISSEGLDPINKARQDYTVLARVEMLNAVGLWQSFPLTFVDTLEVHNLVRAYSTDNEVGPYDVIVKTTYDQYEEGESVGGVITIKNTGDEPDQDTILTYWLEDASGNRYGETKEQILEVLPGTSTIRRSVALPVLANQGEWKFKAEYETVVQPKISVFNTIEVTDLTLWEKINQRLPLLVYRNVVAFWILMFILAVMFVVLVYSLGKRETKPRGKKRIEHVDAHMRVKNR